MNTIIHMRNDAGSGAGSRGGKIIGRTRTGNPIYENHKHPAHQSFTLGEHGDASLKHNELLKASLLKESVARKSKDKNAQKKAEDQSDIHLAGRKHHQNAKGSDE